MRKSILVAAVAVFGGFVYAGSETLMHDDEPDVKLCEQALELLSKGERSGFKLLLGQSSEENDGQKSKFIDSQAGLLRGHIQSLGEQYGFELVDAQEVGHCLRRYTYLCKYDHGRIRWRFTFYRRADDWRFEGYHFDADDNALFAEAGHALTLPDRQEAIAGQRRAPQR
ncbi:MAG TPA: hypothetical protein VG826_22900 [Pirellulales bacterium]|nr:hypothetical protein [Pirellulales bacterium]